VSSTKAASAEMTNSIVRGSRSLRYEPARFRFNEVLIALITCATPTFILFLIVGSPWGYAVVALAVVAALWAVHRALRISLVVTDDGIVVNNYWRTHAFPWSAVEGVGIALKEQGVLPQPALAFKLRDGNAIFAKATPFRQSERKAFLTSVLALAPPGVVRFSDTAASFGIGSDRAPSNLVRRWWEKKRSARS
jgi:Bacterial PH domain